MDVEMFFEREIYKPALSRVSKFATRFVILRNEGTIRGLYRAKNHDEQQILHYVQDDKKFFSNISTVTYKPQMASKLKPFVVYIMFTPVHRLSAHLKSAHLHI
jgi:hypothetical protein